MSYIRGFRIALMLLMFGAPAAGLGQEAVPALRSSLGTTVRVTRTDGSVVSGGLRAYDDGALRVETRSGLVDVPQSAIERVERRRPEPKWNGFLIGLAGGAGTGFLVARAGCGNDRECAFYSTAAYVPLFAGIGAGSGSLLDFAIRKYDVVYSRLPASVRVRFTPILSARRTGVILAFSF